MTAMANRTVFIKRRLANVESSNGLMSPWLTSAPAVTRSEALGRKNPTSNLVSAQTIAIKTGYPPHVRRELSSWRRLKNSWSRSNTPDALAQVKSRVEAALLRAVFEDDDTGPDGADLERVG